MNLLWFLLIGGLAGWIAGLLVRNAGFGVIGDVIVGIIGAVIGGYLFGLLGVSTYGLVGSLVTATVGAVVLLFLFRLLKAA